MLSLHRGAVPPRLTGGKLLPTLGIFAPWPCGAAAEANSLPALHTCPPFFPFSFFWGGDKTPSPLPVHRERCSTDGGWSGNRSCWIEARRRDAAPPKSVLQLQSASEHSGCYHGRCLDVRSRDLRYCPPEIKRGDFGQKKRKATASSPSLPPPLPPLPPLPPPPADLFVEGFALAPFSDVSMDVRTRGGYFNEKKKSVRNVCAKNICHPRFHPRSPAFTLTHVSLIITSIITIIIITRLLSFYCLTLGKDAVSHLHLAVNHNNHRHQCDHILFNVFIYLFIYLLPEPTAVVSPLLAAPERQKEKVRDIHRSSITHQTHSPVPGCSHRATHEGPRTHCGRQPCSWRI